MPKILQIIDVDAEGHKVRLDDGNVIRLPHNSYPQIGQEIEVQPDPEPDEPTFVSYHKAVTESLSKDE